MTNQTDNLINPTSIDHAVDVYDEYRQNGSLPNHLLIVHRDFIVKTLTNEMPFRPALTGEYTTNQIGSYVEYVNQRLAEMDSNEGVRTFIDAQKPNSYLSATTILNFGVTNQAGHANDLAVLNLQKDPLFFEFLHRLDGQTLTPKKFALVLEEYRNNPFVKGIALSGADITLPKLIDSLRNFKIDKQQQSEVKTQHLAYEASEFEKIELQNAENLIPTHLQYVTGIYDGLQPQEVRILINPIYGEDKPTVEFNIRAVGLTHHYNVAAESFKSLLTPLVPQPLIGVYTKA